MYNGHDLRFLPVSRRKTGAGDAGSRRMKQCLRDKSLLEKKGRNGWTPLIEESFQGRVDNVLSLLRLAKSAYGDDGLREYVRTRDDLGIDACGWARLHKHKNWQVIDLLTRYGAY